MKRLKDIILKEGFRSMSSEGIRSFTVEDLASKLSMSKKTIYQYFPKKEILIKKVIDYRMKKLTDQFNKSIEDESDPIVQFIKIREHNIKFSGKLNLNRLVYLKTRYPDIWDRIEKYREDREKIFITIFTSAKKQNLLRENLEPVTAAKIYTNIFNATFQPEFLVDKNISIDQAVNHMKVIIENGFFSDDGIKKIKDFLDKK